MPCRNRKDTALTWNASQILWQEQLVVLLILLPPIFLSAILVALKAPRLFANQGAAATSHIEDSPAPQQPARAA
jgi:hypothetical protein